MYVKNNDFYFDKNDYLNFNNIKFTLYGYSNYRIIRKIDYDYEIKLYLKFNHETSSYKMYVDFNKVRKTLHNSYTSLSFVYNKQKDKMLLLYKLRKIMSLICKAIILCKHHENIPGVCINSNSIVITIQPARETNNLVNLYNCSIDLYVGTSDSIKEDNTILLLCKLTDTDDIKSNIFAIKSNVLYRSNSTIIYPKLYNFYLEKNITQPIMFFNENYYDYLINKAQDTYYISYYTPLSLLFKFIDSIELFDNLYEIRVNNEYDLLKYI